MADYTKKIIYEIDVDESQAVAKISRINSGMAIAVPLDFAPGKQAPQPATPPQQPSPTARTTPQPQPEPDQFGGASSDITILLSGIEDRISECCHDLGMLVSKIEDHLADGFRDLGMLKSKIEDHAAAGFKVNRGGNESSESSGIPTIDRIADDVDSLLDTAMSIDSLLGSIDDSGRMQAGRQLRENSEAKEEHPQPQSPGEGEQAKTPAWVSMLPRLLSVGTGAAGVAAGAAGYAANPTSIFGGISAAGGVLSGLGGIAGGAVGGPAGMAIAGVAAAAATAASAIATMANAAMSAAESLKNYSGILFGAMTGFDLFMMGLKFQLAGALGPSLAQVIFKIEELLVAMEPLIIQFTELANSALVPVINVLIKFAQAIEISVASIEYLIAWLDQKMGGALSLSLAGLGIGGGIPNMQTATNNLLTAVQSFMAPISSIASAVNQMLADGQTIALWMFRGMRDFSHDPKTHIGPQTTGQGGMHPSQVTPSYLNPNYLTYEQMPGANQLGRFWHATTSNNAITNLVNQQVANTSQKQQPGGQAAPIQPTPHLPRPTPAAMSLHIADNVQISPAEDDRLHTELMQWLDYVREAVDNMNSGRWHRLASARARTGDM